MTKLNENRIWSAELIQNKLAELGCEDVAETINDVTDIVELRIFSAVYNKLPDDLKNTLNEKTDDEIKNYFDSHINELPKLSQEELFGIEDKTWSEYFTVIEK